VIGQHERLRASVVMLAAVHYVRII
jgi:hypothetical protein